MRRVLGSPLRRRVAQAFLPRTRATVARDWLAVGVVTDRTDGKLVHLDGLNLSRAWMLEGIASGLPEKDPRIPALRAAAMRHRSAGLSAVTEENYRRRALAGDVRYLPGDGARIAPLPGSR